MSDYLLPPALNIARATFRYLDSTGVSRNPYNGIVRTASLGGDRLGCSLETTMVGGGSSQTAMQRAQLLAFIASMRGRQNRAYMWDRAYTPRGSFPVSELLANADFSQGTTGWTVTGTMTVADNVARITSTVSGSLLEAYQSITPVAYAPYAVRVLTIDGNLSAGMTVGPFIAGGTFGNDYSATRGLRTVAGVVPSGSASYGCSGQTAGLAGTFIELPYVSMSRCALVDAGSNVMLRSDEADNAAWTKINTTVPVTTDTAPDNAADARRLTESATTSSHGLSQSGTRTSAAADLVAYGFFKRSVSTRDIRLYIGNDVSTNYSTVIFDLNAGSAGTVSNNGTSTNGRALIANAGNGWWFCSLVARAVAATTIAVEFDMVNTGATSYLGTTGALDTWRLGAAVSGVPVSPQQTVASALPSGVSPTGTSVNLKGLPVSTNGLLLPSDQVEIITSYGSEIKLVTSALNSDASGLGTLQVSPPLRGVAADNAAVIIYRPMGRFVYSGSGMEWPTEPGILTATSFDFEEAVG